jgi:hypothetical protein
MGKRGPQPNGEYGTKAPRRAVFSARIQPDTRAQLSKAAKASGRSLSQEFEHRLRRTFIEDERDLNFYGSQSNAAIIRLLGTIIQRWCTSWRIKIADDWITDVHRDPEEWLRDPWLFDEVVTALMHALMWFRPPGKHDKQSVFFHSDTEELINEIRSSDPSLPITKRSTPQHARAMLKDKLGHLAKRPHPYDDWLKKAQPAPIIFPKPAKRKLYEENDRMRSGE